MDNDLIVKYRTLGVIGLVVIIGLVIITSFLSLKEKKDFSYKSKMFFADLSQAVQYSVNNNGLPGQWGFLDDSDNISVINNFLLSSVRISKDCLNEKKGCFQSADYKNLSGQNTSTILSKYPSVVMKNGVSLAFESKGNCANKGDVCLVIFADINGLNSPNVIGKDLLVFELMNTDSAQLKPWGSSLGFAAAINDKRYGCTKTARLPFACSALLFSKNWRYDKTYPW